MNAAYWAVVGSGYNLIQDDDKSNLNENAQSPKDPPIEVVIPEVYSNPGADDSRGAFGNLWSRTLRIKITGNDGSEKLDVRIPVSQMLVDLSSISSSPSPLLMQCVPVCTW